MKRFIFAGLLAGVVLSVGCASTGNDYYAAVEKAAQANALASEAKYRALAQVASSGDGQAASAAVMAIALSKDNSVVPQYVESNALKWAQVLSPTIGTLGLGMIQANVARNASDNAAKVQMASMSANAEIQLGQQQMVTDLGGQWSDAAAAGGAAVVELGLAGFNALNTAGDQTVTLGVAGLNTADSIATTGFTTVGNVATTGMDNLNEMGQFGMTTVGAVGMHGLDKTTELGKWGMEGIWTTNKDWLEYSTTSDTNFANIIADFNATIRQFGTDLATPITCNQTESGAFNCTGG